MKRVDKRVSINEDAEHERMHSEVPRSFLRNYQIYKLICVGCKLSQVAFLLEQPNRIIRTLGVEGNMLKNGALFVEKVYEQQYEKFLNTQYFLARKQWSEMSGDIKLTDAISVRTAMTATRAARRKRYQEKRNMSDVPVEIQEHNDQIYQDIVHFLQTSSTATDPTDPSELPRFQNTGDDYNYNETQHNVATVAGKMTIYGQTFRITKLWHKYHAPTKAPQRQRQRRGTSQGKAPSVTTGTKRKSCAPPSVISIRRNNRESERTLHTKKMKVHTTYTITTEEYKKEEHNALLDSGRFDSINVLSPGVIKSGAHTHYNADSATNKLPGRAKKATDEVPRSPHDANKIGGELPSGQEPSGNAGDSAINILPGRAENATCMAKNAIDEVPHRPHNSNEIGGELPSGQGRSSNAGGVEKRAPEVDNPSAKHHAHDAENTSKNSGESGKSTRAGKDGAAKQGSGSKPNPNLENSGGGATSGTDLSFGSNNGWKTNTDGDTWQLSTDMLQNKTKKHDGANKHNTDRAKENNAAQGGGDKSTRDDKIPNEQKEVEENKSHRQLELGKLPSDLLDIQEKILDSSRCTVTEVGLKSFYSGLYKSYNIAESKCYLPLMHVALHSISDKFFDDLCKGEVKTFRINTLKLAANRYHGSLTKHNSRPEPVTLYETFQQMSAKQKKKNDKVSATRTEQYDLDVRDFARLLHLNMLWKANLSYDTTDQPGTGMYCCPCAYSATWLGSMNESHFTADGNIRRNRLQEKLKVTAETSKCRWTTDARLLMKHIAKNAAGCKYHGFLKCLLHNHVEKYKKKKVNVPARKKASRVISLEGQFKKLGLLEDFSESLFGKYPSLKEYDVQAATERRLNTVDTVVANCEGAIEERIAEDDDEIQGDNHSDSDSGSGMRGTKEKRVEDLTEQVRKFACKLAEFHIFDIGFQVKTERVKSRKLNYCPCCRLFKDNFKLESDQKYCNNTTYNNSGLVAHAKTKRNDIWHEVIYGFLKLNHYK